MKASNFNKGLGPDGFDGTILRPGDMSHRLTQEISAQILRLLNNPMSIPQYLYEGRLVLSLEEQGQGPGGAQGHQTDRGEVPCSKDLGKGYNGEGGSCSPAPTLNKDLPVWI